MVLYGLAREPVDGACRQRIAGASWIAALATLSVSAQVALPDWVRGRGLALYTTVFFGCLTLGSAAWGEVAALLGLPVAHFLAAAGRCRRHSADLALETANRRRHRSVAVHALAGADHRAGNRARSRPGPGHGRIPHPSAGPRGVPGSTRQARARAAPRRRLSPGACSRMPPRRDASSRPSWSNPGWSICASTSASPSRSPGAGGGASVSIWSVQPEGHAFHRRRLVTGTRQFPRIRWRIEPAAQIRALSSRAACRAIAAA